MDNTAPTEYLATSNTDPLNIYTTAAIGAWNSALQGSPNNLSSSSFVFHFIQQDDPNANVHIVGFTNVAPNFDFSQHCPISLYGCVDDDLTAGESSWDPYAAQQFVFVDLTNVPSNSKQSLIAHELGHLLFFNEHYTVPTDGQHCGTGYSGTYYSVMDNFLCDNPLGPTAHDEQDFLDAYKPKDPPNLTTMTINSSSSVTIAWSGAYTHNIWRYYYERTNGTGDSSVDSGTTSNTSTTNKQYSSIADGHRRCATAKGRTDAGYQSGNEDTPRSYYGCYSRQTGSAGRLLATSHRNYGSVMQVRNSSGGTRDIIVTGPGLQNLGCPVQSVSNGSVYACNASVGLFQYTELLVVMTNTSTGAQTLALIDFE